MSFIQAPVLRGFPPAAHQRSVIASVGAVQVVFRRRLTTELQRRSIASAEEQTLRARKRQPNQLTLSLQIRRTSVRLAEDKRKGLRRRLCWDEGDRWNATVNGTPLSTISLDKSESSINYLSRCRRAATFDSNWRFYRWQRRNDIIEQSENIVSARDILRMNLRVYTVVERNARNYKKR